MNSNATSRHFDRILQDEVDLLEERVTGRDARNDKVVEWVPYARNIRASVEQIFTDDRLSRRDVSHVRFRCYIHTNANWRVEAEHRIRWPSDDGKIYRIEGEPNYLEDTLVHFPHVEIFMELFD